MLEKRGPVRADPTVGCPPLTFNELGDELVIEIELPGSQNDMITTRGVVGDEATVESQQVFHVVVEGRRDPVRGRDGALPQRAMAGGFARLFRVPIAYDESK